MKQELMYQIKDTVENRIIDYHYTKEEALQDVKTATPIEEEGTGKKFYPENWIVEPKNFNIWRKN